MNKNINNRNYSKKKKKNNVFMCVSTLSKHIRSLPRRHALHWTGLVGHIRPESQGGHGVKASCWCDKGLGFRG